MTEDERYAQGMKMRREILGDEHVDRAIAQQTPETADFQALITRYAWGEIWTRPGLDARTRRLLVLAMTIALGRDEEFALHLRAALRAGVAREPIVETILQGAIYCGVPAANHAFALARTIFAEFDSAERP
jgi:4-carboxymuconolactone decarboxylase